MTVKKNKLIFAMGLIALSLLIVLLGCGKNSKPSTSPASIVKNISISGSTALEPFIQKSIEDFSKTYKDIVVKVTGNSSGLGLSQLVSGTTDVAMSDLFSEEVLSPEIAKTLIDTKISVQGFSFIVHPNVTIETLSQKQLIDIFTGKITNWRSLGGYDKPIVLISRPMTSGARTVIRKYALNGFNESALNSQIFDSNADVKKAVSENEGSISYVSLNYLKDDTSVKKIKFENIDATSENIISGKYPLWSYEHLYAKAPVKGDVLIFINAILSAGISPEQKQMGFIPIEEMRITR